MSAILDELERSDDRDVAYCPAAKRATSAVVSTPCVTPTHASAARSTAG
jgi:hypothetical protein